VATVAVFAVCAVVALCALTAFWELTEFSTEFEQENPLLPVTVTTWPAGQVMPTEKDVPRTAGRGASCARLSDGEIAKRAAAIARKGRMVFGSNDVFNAIVRICRALSIRAIYLIRNPKQTNLARRRRKYVCRVE
jgi:hypothetical protein